jgi:GT2 family glycosyltransferase
MDGEFDMLTSIIMLTKNRLDVTMPCVESIFKHTPEDFEIVFIDNGSTDGTPEYLETVPRSRLIRNKENLGFAAGVNQGLVEAKGDYILLINNDTVVTPEWLSGLHYWLASDPRIGIVGPVSNNISAIQRVDDMTYTSLDGLDDYARERRRKYAKQGFYPHRLIGYCMLFHRSLIDLIGGFDEQFFPGNYEDDDFSLRTRILGKILWVAQDVFIHHESSATFYNLNTLEGNRRDMLANAEKFCKKWNTDFTAEQIVTHGYNPSDVVAKVPYFIPRKHYYPIKGLENRYKKYFEEGEG